MADAHIDRAGVAVTDTGGDGPPVLLVHGASDRGGAPGAYDHQVAALSDVNRVLTARLPHDVLQGATDAWGPPRALFRLLDGIGIERVVLCGADDTAQILVRAALLHPDRVRGLAFLHPDLASLAAARARPGADADLDDLDARLEELAMPVVVIHGDGDPERPVGDVDRVLRLVSDPRGLVVIAGGSRSVSVDHAGTVTAALRDYLEGLPA